MPRRPMSEGGHRPRRRAVHVPTPAHDDQVVLTLWHRYKTTRNWLLSVAGGFVTLVAAYAIIAYGH